MAEWREIPGNPDVYKKLVELLRSGEAVGFVGAGASAGLYPLWPRLIEELADAAVQRTGEAQEVKQALLSIDSLQAASLIRNKLRPGPFVELIRRIFRPKVGDGELGFTATHAALVRLGCTGFVTTNYDPALKLAFQALRPELFVRDFDWRDDRVTLWQEGRPAQDRELPILHAHGRYDDGDSLVIDAESYLAAYSEGPYASLLNHLWVNQQLVIVGFSFQDVWLRIFANKALRESGSRKVSDRRHFALIGAPDDEAFRLAASVHREAIENEYHLRALFYPVRTVRDPGGKERKDHSALGKLLGDLITAKNAGRPASTPKVAPKSKVDPLVAWFRQVQDEHCRVVDQFDRPPELRLLEQAWVQVMVQPAVEEKALEGSDHELLRKPMKLDEAVALPLGKPSWNQGRWLLEGSPGSGKTTLLRHYAARLAEAASPDRIPLFASLPKLVETGQELVQHATDGLGIAGVEGLRRALAAAGREGRVVLLLDSFDEVPRERRDAVLRFVSQLSRDDAWRRCRVVISSRPIGRGDALDGLPQLDLLALDPERRLEFLEKWLRHDGRAGWKTEAKVALDHFLATRGLRDLSGIPLYLTLLATLLAKGKQPSENLADLYQQVFDLLLEGGHRKDPTPMPDSDLALEALRHLAHDMTQEDLWAEPVKKLQQRLRKLPELCDRLCQISEWRAGLHRFLGDVHEKTLILGPHDGRQGDWRFWHRTFREALTAEHLRQQHAGSSPEALLQWAQNLEEGGEGRWAEPLALLTGRLKEPDELVLKLGESNPKLALRATAFAQGLQPETVVATLKLAKGNPDERAKVFEGLPDQLGDPSACLALVEQLKEGCRNGFDLYWLWWIVEEVQRRWPRDPRAADLFERFFDHIPAPNDLELFRTLDTPLGGAVDLWREIPAGEGWVGSPKNEEGRDGDEGPRHRVRIPQAFWLGAGPVTNAQYAAFDPDKDFEPWGDVSNDELRTHPRVRVTWYEALSFCRWLGRQPGFKGTSPRLPIEEEWEVACRAGTETRFWSGNAETDLEEVGWFDDNSEDSTHRVGEKRANKWGLYDVHGNVWEWTASPWEPERYKNRPQNSPHLLDPAAAAADLAAPPRVGRVLRGGCFWVTARWCRSAYRVHRRPRNEIGDQGFRVLLSSAPSRDSRR
ncbi:MAG: SUMF1/EgtB/PvdO family nonheme iron enzyme [Acidobacteriota bacterium]